MEGIRLGPIGPTTPINDTAWDETGHKAISLIIVSFDKHGATTIQFGYIKNGTLIMSRTYGSESNDTVFSRRVVRLNHETEFVTGISGEAYGGNISSLTFHTNQRTHEAFHLTFDSGKVEKREFHSGILERREFEGFFGTCYWGRLRTLNLLVRYIFTGVETIKKEKV